MYIDDTLAGWIPLFLSSSGSQPKVNWGYMGEARFTEPFCQETLQKLATKPFNQFFSRQSGMDLLLERATSHPGLPLDGIVFHMSRCGSTLASQWLAALPDSVVLSEPEPVDVLLQSKATDDAAIRALISAMGQPRRTSDRRLFLKTDCWHTAQIDRLLAAFPDTPWIFMYRDPVEVLVSHQRMPGWLVVPGSLKNHGFNPPEELMCNPLGNAAWVLSTVMQQAHDAMLRHGNGLLLNYSELPQALEDRVARHFGVCLTPQEADALRTATHRHSKRGNEAFKPDAADKRNAANAVILELAARWLNEPYQRLEQLRRSPATPI